MTATRDLLRLPAGVRTLVATLQDIAEHGEQTPVADQVAVVEPALATALRDPGTRSLYRGHESSYLVWSIPGGLTLHASVHRPGHVTPAHDHGAAWAVYGVVAGPTSFGRYARGVDPRPGVADLVPAGEVLLRAGQTEVIWPGEVHSVANRTAEWGWNLVVRSRALQEIERSVFDIVSGAYRTTGAGGLL